MESSQAGAPAAADDQSSPAGVQAPGEDQPTQPVGDAPSDAPQDAPEEAPQDGGDEAAPSEPEHADTSVSGATAPAGAVQPDAETGVPRQHGEITPGLGQAPSDFPDAGEAVEAGGVSEPEQVEVDRPDIGTPTEGGE